MATRITQRDLEVGGEASSVAFTPAGESIALTVTVTELVADSVVQMIIVDDQGLVKSSARVFGTGAKKVVVGKLDGTITVTVMQLQGSGQVIVADPDGGAVETTDLANLSVTTPKLADNAVWTAKILDLNVTTAKIALLAVETAQCEVGLLSADADGRALIADDHFVAASFVAGAGGKFAPDCLDATACANVFPAAAIPVAKVASAPFSLETNETPASAAAIVATTSGTSTLTSAGGAETNTLADPSAVGITRSIFMDVHGGGDRVITTASPVNSTGNNTLTFGAAEDWIVLVGVSIASALEWRILLNANVGLTTV